MCITLNQKEKQYMILNLKKMTLPLCECGCVVVQRKHLENTYLIEVKKNTINTYFSCLSWFCSPISSLSVSYIAVKYMQKMSKLSTAYYFIAAKATWG